MKRREPNRRGIDYNGSWIYRQFIKIYGWCIGIYMGSIKFNYNYIRRVNTWEQNLNEEK